MTYLLTFTCYGQHLPGAEGWVDRLRGNHTRGGLGAPYSPLEAHAKANMRQPPQTLTKEDAQIVLTAIREVCQHRHWPLLAAHIRTTHAHLVADDLPDPNRAIGDCKAYATRALRHHHNQPSRLYWARGGFSQRLPNTEARRAAIHYVLRRQGELMALYDRSQDASLRTRATHA